MFSFHRKGVQLTHSAADDCQFDTTPTLQFFLSETAGFSALQSTFDFLVIFSTTVTKIILLLETRRIFFFLKKKMRELGDW